jgi:hypothetical protein
MPIRHKYAARELPAESFSPPGGSHQGLPARAGSQRKGAILTSLVSLVFAAVNLGCADPAGLADLWGKVLGRPVSPGVTAPTP